MPSQQSGEKLTERKDRVVIDTGVLISAFAFGGLPEKAVKKAFAEADVCISPALLKEYREVPLALERGGKITAFQLKALISGLASIVAKGILGTPYLIPHESLGGTDKTGCIINEMNSEGYKPWQEYWVRQRDM